VMKICFIDMDGVLCDFVSAACAVFGRRDLPSNWPLGERSMGAALGCSDKDFWETIKADPGFWSNMHPYPWCHELFDTVKEFGYEPFISTSPSLDPASASGKTEWIQRVFGRSFRSYFIGGKKHALAMPGRVLIDDRNDTVDKFCACGGIGILFPRRWNSLHGISNDPMAFVRESLGRASKEQS
jgi:5'(3')-deoxyribonucleotidase